MVVPRTYVLIDEIGVLATEQGQGIGRRLVDAAVAWARAKGASGIELQVYEFNEGAIAFYEHVGFCTIRRAMALPVKPA
jgi:ribosomal protein S18 acetylase RimI-like enzyme